VKVEGLGMALFLIYLYRHFTQYLCVVSTHNTLYVEVHCPMVRPDVVVISNSGQTVTDFGQVSVGQRVVKSITVQNISDHSVDVSLLDR